MIALLPENCLYSSPFFNEISFKDNNENKPSKNVILAATNSHLSEVQIPTFLSTVKFPNLFWEESNVKSIKFSRVFREKVYRGFYKMVSKYSELTNAFSEFGAALNAFSLSEESTLSEAIECVGQCVDLSYNCYGIVVEKLSVEILEDYEYFDDTYSSLRQVLIYRNNKQIQFETVSDLLNIMQTELDSLLKLDADAHRLSIALSSDESTQDSSNLSNKNLLEYQKNNEELVHSIDNHLIKANKDSKDKHNEPFPAFAINKDTTIPKNQVHSLESNEAETYLNKGINKKNYNTDFSTSNAIDFKSSINAARRYTEKQLEEDPYLQFQLEQSMSCSEIPSAIPNIFQSFPDRFGETSQFSLETHSKDLANGLNSNRSDMQNIGDSKVSESVNESNDIVKGSSNLNLNESNIDKVSIPDSTEAKSTAVTNRISGSNHRLIRRSDVLEKLTGLGSILTQRLIGQLTFSVFKLIDYDPVIHRQMKIRQVTDKISESVSTLDCLKKDLDIISEDVKSTLELLQMQKKLSFKSSLLKMAKVHIDMSTQVKTDIS
ncbi:Sorting nexin-41 [Smittium culicis]|uniref:Sorting nexin-41 n=1 Tax=Smittium culicis TaxID=133412 RepID=A0A1R1XK13_9FUNG|nr:Sorting nexin-41 [Smittium culicis]